MTFQILPPNNLFNRYDTRIVILSMTMIFQVTREVLGGEIGAQSLVEVLPVVKVISD